MYLYFPFYHIFHRLRVFGARILCHETNRCLGGFQTAPSTCSNSLSSDGSCHRVDTCKERVALSPNELNVGSHSEVHQADKRNHLEMRHEVEWKSFFILQVEDISAEVRDVGVSRASA